MYQVSIRGTDRVMYVNPKDRRGGRMIRFSGLSQPRVTNFWRHSVNALKPSLVVDAGVNYGEVLLSSEYPVDTVIAAIEANEMLLPYLGRSIEEHPNASQIQIVHALVSDEDREKASFFVNKLHSGLSSAHPEYSKSSRQVELPTTTIDSIFKDRDVNRDTLLFKMDIEGYEWHALRGMKRLLTQCGTVVGCIEFTFAYLHSKNIATAEFLFYLQQSFVVCTVNRRGQLVEFTDPVNEVPKYFALDKGCNDLMLLSRRNLFDLLK